MDIAGFAASVAIGISLGLIGGGGSILTVPVLVYLFRVDAIYATAYSLFVVGTTSTFGSLSYLKKGLVSLKTVAVFGIPSIVSVFLTRQLVVPVIPDKIAEIGGLVVTKAAFLMLLFAVLMVFASYSMIKTSKDAPETTNEKHLNDFRILFQGVFIGVVTGLVGAGGGFLIIPALVNICNIPMKTAVGTSLVIIALNSLAGFLFSVANTSVHWSLLLGIAFAATLGILLGSFISTKIDGAKLKPAFGWFVLMMGIYIILRELS